MLKDMQQAGIFKQLALISDEKWGCDAVLRPKKEETENASFRLLNWWSRDCVIHTCIQSYSYQRNNALDYVEDQVESILLLDGSRGEYLALVL